MVPQFDNTEKGTDKMTITFSNPDAVAAPVSNYSQVARVDLGAAILIFISGQGPVDVRGQTVGADDPARQAEQVFTNIGAILEAHGATPHDVAKLTIFLTDIRHRPFVSEARDRSLSGAAPTSTLVEVNHLAVSDWMIEVEAIAIVKP